MWYNWMSKKQSNYIEVSHMSDKLKIKELEEKVKILEFQQKQLISVVLHKSPDWAKDSLKAAETAGLVELPFMGVRSDGSYDFYRIIDLLYKLQLI